MRKNEPTGNKLFDIFWDKYPRKESKPKALNWFKKNKVTPEILEEIMSELEYQRAEKDWNHIQKKYIPMALTWLNRRDWEVERDGSNSKPDTADSGNQYGSVVL